MGQHFRRVPSELHSNWAGSSSQAGSRQQDRKVSGTWQHRHLLPSCHRDSRFMERAGRRTGAGDRKTQHHHHRGQQRNYLPVSEAVCGSAEGKCGLILRQFPHMISPLFQSFTVSVNFKACGFVLVGEKILIIITIITTTTTIIIIHIFLFSFLNTYV